LKEKISEEKAYARARMSISQFASNPLPSPDPSSSSFSFFNGGFPWSLYEFESWNSPLFAAKYTPFKDEFAAQMEENRVENQKTTKKDDEIGGYHGVAATTG